jgi:hypothetical protein
VIFDAKGKQTLIRRFAECFDALGAERFLDQATIFHNRNLLQIRFECAIGCMLGKRTFVTKGGCFTAGVTLSHISDPFSTMIPVPARGHVFEGAKPLFKGTGFYHITQPSSR